MRLKDLKLNKFKDIRHTFFITLHEGGGGNK